MLDDIEVIITNRELASLCEDRDMLLCLQNAGVDNWVGYDYAVKLFRELRGGNGE